MDKAKDIDQFIDGYPEDVRDILAGIRTIVHEEAPEATESISYGIPTFKLHGKNLVHFSAFTHNIGFYPTPSGMSDFAVELSRYKSGKGSVQFPLDQPIPYDLIRAIVRSRVQETRDKA